MTGSHPSPPRELDRPIEVAPGDWAERDMVGAKKVGLVTVFARYGDTQNTQQSGADYEIDDILQLLDIVKKENS